MVTALWLKRQINDNIVRVVVSFSTVCGISGMFYIHKVLCIIEVNKYLVAKILLTNVTTTNEHLNVVRFVHALLYGSYTTNI